LRRPKKRIVLGYANIANLITLAGLLCSLAACFFAFEGNLPLCMTLLIASGLCDLFDGVVARKLKRTGLEQNFGLQLDTVVDMVSFGVAPALVVFAVADATWYALLIYAFFIVCATVRLAYFNATADAATPTTHYRGLPVTCIAFILPIVMLFHSEIASLVALAVFGILFMLYFKLPKPRGVIWNILIPALSAVLITLWWWL